MKGQGMKKGWFLGAVLVAATAALAPGRAAAEYVCQADYFPRGSSPLAPSRCRVIVNTLPACAGSAVGTFWYCEKDATSTLCASGSSMRYERDELLTLFKAAAEAARTGQSVLPSMTTCNGGGSGCGAYLSFRP